MEDYKILIYVALGALYYGFKFFSKNRGDAEAALPRESGTSEGRGGGIEQNKRPTTIQELLEEVKKENRQHEKPIHRPFYETQESLEQDTIDYESNPEKAKVENVNPYQEYGTIDVGSVGDKTPRFAEYATKPRPKHPILESLDNKDKTKKAFIVAEILARKEF